MDRFCRQECPYRRSEDCVLPVVPERILNGSDMALGYLVSSAAIVGNGLNGVGNMESALRVQQLASARVAARRERIMECVTLHSSLVRLAAGETGC
jgi:hypothetical protein